ncbi:MAG: hypothetical protein M1826_005305 [Phylliscum demangeonii]|nr:MAG: hypothetical protein M1826_005305 [Phylliscum demangeonii]
MLVLGTEGQALNGGVVATTTMGAGRRWSSNASTLSDYSQSSTSSSTVTTTTTVPAATTAAAAAHTPHPHTHAHAHAHAYTGAGNGGSSSGCICACRHAHSNPSRPKMLILREAMKPASRAPRTRRPSLYTWGKKTLMMPTSFGAAP